MNCEAMQRKILLEASGELSAREARALAGHVAACERCRAWRAEAGAAHSLMELAAVDRIPGPAVVARIVAAAEERKGARTLALPPRIAQALACAAALLVAAGVWLVLPHKGRSDRITELHALLATVADGKAEQSDPHAEGSGEQDLQRLARQLLLMEGFGADEIIVEEPSATDPLSHSTDAPPAETCV
jgi:hypothetical protein